MYGDFCWVYNRVMKKFFLLLAIIGIAAFVYTARDSKPQLGFQKPGSTEDFKPDPSNATFLFEDGPITLSGGRGEKDTEQIDLVEQVGYAYGDINNDKKDDAAVYLARYGGGSGTFIYLGAYISGPVNYKGTNAVFLGDRIFIENLSIKGGVITVEYLDRDNEDAFSTEPTIQVSKQFVFRNGVLEER